MIKVEGTIHVDDVTIRELLVHFLSNKYGVSIVASDIQFVSTNLHPNSIDAVCKLSSIKTRA